MLNALPRRQPAPLSTVVACPGRLNDFLENGQVLGLNWCEMHRNAQKQSFHELSSLHPPAHTPTFHSMAFTGSFGWSSEAGFRRGSLLVRSCWFGTMSNVEPAKQFLLLLQLSVWNLEPQRHQCRLQADRMLDMGFEPQIRKILAKVWVIVENISRSCTKIEIQGYHLIIFNFLSRCMLSYSLMRNLNMPPCNMSKVGMS